MSESAKPKYPIYVISKGRADQPLTANFLIKDKLPFHIVVEPQEADRYIEAVGKERVLVLPFANLGQGSIPARNWVWEHSISIGADKHWILDDNIRMFNKREMVNGKVKRKRCDSTPGFVAMEKLANAYQNVAILGPNYSMFVPDSQKVPPFRVNAHVYSTLLIRNDLKYRWRGRYNEDVDLCLQVLSGGWCTIQVQAYLIQKVATMKMKGGNTDELYAGDGVVKKARSLERLWPGIVTVDRRFGRPQHVVNWRKFKTRLIGIQ